MDKCPDATLFVAQIIGAADPTFQKRFDTFNAKIPGIVGKTGKHVLSCNMALVKGSLLSSDGIHPNDEGYDVLAREWFNCIRIADSNGWIKAPVKVAKLHPDNPSCISKRDDKPVAGEKSGHFCREYVS